MLIAQLNMHRYGFVNILDAHLVLLIIPLHSYVWLCIQICKL